MRNEREPLPDLLMSPACRWCRQPLHVSGGLWRNQHGKSVCLEAPNDELLHELDRSLPGAS